MKRNECGGSWRCTGGVRPTGTRDWTRTAAKFYFCKAPPTKTNERAHLNNKKISKIFQDAPLTSHSSNIFAGMTKFPVCLRREKNVAIKIYRAKLLQRYQETKLHKFLGFWTLLICIKKSIGEICDVFLGWSDAIYIITEIGNGCSSQVRI